MQHNQYHRTQLNQWKSHQLFVPSIPCSLKRDDLACAIFIDNSHKFNADLKPVRYVYPNYNFKHIYFDLSTWKISRCDNKTKLKIKTKSKGNSDYVYNEDSTVCQIRTFKTLCVFFQKSVILYKFNNGTRQILF